MVVRIWRIEVERRQRAGDNIGGAAILRDPHRTAGDEHDDTTVSWITGYVMPGAPNGFAIRLHPNDIQLVERCVDHFAAEARLVLDLHVDGDKHLAYNLLPSSQLVDSVAIYRVGDAHWEAVLGVGVRTRHSFGMVPPCPISDDR